MSSVSLPHTSSVSERLPTAGTLDSVSVFPQYLMSAMFTWAQARAEPRESRGSAGVVTDREEEAEENDTGVPNLRPRSGGDDQSEDVSGPLRTEGT